MFIDDQPYLPKINRAYLGLLISGVLTFVLGLTGKIAFVFYRVYLVEFLSGKRFFSSTSIEVFRTLPVDLCVIGTIIILMALVYNFVSKREEDWEDYYYKREIILSQNITKYQDYFLCAIIFLMAGFIYHNVVGGFFPRSEFQMLVSAQTESLSSLLKTHNFFWRPVPLLYFKIIGKIFGLSSVAFYLFNILTHCVSAILLYLILKLITKDSLLPFLGSLIFISRLSSLDAIYYTTAPDRILALPLLLSVYFYLLAQKNRYFLIVSVLFFIISIMTKEMAITLPLLLAAYEFILGQRTDTLKEKIINLLKKTWVFFTLIIFYFIYRALFCSSLSNPLNFTGTCSLKELEIDINLISNLINYTRFSFNGPYDPITIFVFTFIFIGVFYWGKNRMGSSERIEIKLFSYGVCWFFISLLPVLFLWRVAKYYLYIPSIGFSIAIAALFSYWIEEFQIRHFILGKIALLSFIIITFLYGSFLIGEKAQEKIELCKAQSLCILKRK